MSRKFFALWSLTLCAPGTALAHTSVEGIGSFYNGLLHPIVVPAHLLLLISVGLFLGQQGPRRVELALITYLVGTVIGLIAAWFSMGSGLEIFILSLSAILGLLVALSLKVLVPLCAVIALLAGFILGMDSPQEELMGSQKLVTLVGTGISIILLAIYPMALANAFNKKNWQTIGIRIVGSWIAACSFLVLALKIAGSN